MLVRSSPYVPMDPGPEQWAFIADDTPELFYGGQVGGGKTVSLLATALMYAEVPGYSALIIRRSFPDLMQPGGPMHVANEWLGDTDAHKSDGGKTWTFPSGATLRFGHIESPAEWIRYKGGEYQFIGIDELPDIEAEVWENLSTRIRKSLTLHPELAMVPGRMRGTGNPGGKFAKWVKEYFISSEEGIPVHSPERLFIPSKTTDNPHLDYEDYRTRLDRLDPVKRAQMRDGDWLVQVAGNLFSAESFVMVDGRMTESAHRVRAWDLAGSGNKKSDYCAGVLMARSKTTGLYRVEHVIHERLEPGPLEARMRQTAELDGKDVKILIEEERSGSGKLAVSNLRRNVLRGFHVYGERPSGDKVQRAGLASALVDRNEVELTRSPWNEKFIQECVGFGPDAAYDDMCDAFSYACHHLSRLPVRKSEPLGDNASERFDGSGEGQRLGEAPTTRESAPRNRTFFIPPPTNPGGRVRRSPFDSAGVRNYFKGKP